MKSLRLMRYAAYAICGAGGALAVTQHVAGVCLFVAGLLLSFAAVAMEEGR